MTTGSRVVSTRQMRSQPGYHSTWTKKAGSESFIQLSDLNHSLMKESLDPLEGRLSDDITSII